MKQVRVNDQRIGRWIAGTAVCQYNPQYDHVVGVVDDSFPEGESGWVRGGIIYTNYTQASLWMHVAGTGETWFTREMLFMTFYYPFEQLGCGRVFGMIEAANTPSLKFAFGLGFEWMATLPGMFASGAGLVVSMERSRCKWLKKPKNPRFLVSGGWAVGGPG